MVQGDVGAPELHWSASTTAGKSFEPYAASRTIATNPSLPAGGSNNNPGLVGTPDGSFSGGSSVVYGSSYGAGGWGRWHLFNTAVSYMPATDDCRACAPVSCDLACAHTLGQPAVGTCAHPGSSDPARCCSCAPAPPEPDCSACAPGGCVAACVAAGHEIGVCEHPGSTNSAACCACF